MEVVVVGAGPAGLTAAYRLAQAGHDVQVLERQAVAGGRTHTEHFGEGHWNDTGAGWLGGFYRSTLALFDELGERSRLVPMQLRGGGDLRIDGEIVPFPSSLRRVLSTSLLGPADKARLVAYTARLLVRQPSELEIDERYDGTGAVEELVKVGEAARERVVRPLFEGPFFSRLEEMSAALLRSWMRELAVGDFFQVDGGMDAPWRALGERLGVRTSVAVESIVRRPDGRVDVVVDGTSRTADACVVAVPAPLAAELVAGAPAWLGEVRYAPHVRLYAARRAPGPPRRGVHVFPNDVVATVELGAGRFGSWGRVPDDWCWALVCAPAASSDRLLELPEEEAKELLWRTASAIEPRLFDLDSADVVDLIRWPHAVPIVAPGYHHRLRELRLEPPVLYAGDWTVQPCVEGAVRSGERAAAALGPAGQARS